MTPENPTETSSGFQTRVANVVFRWRNVLLAFFAVFTLAMFYQASKLKIEAGLEKQLPSNHPYIKNVFLPYQSQFGGANRLLVAVQNDTTKPGGGEIFDADFLLVLQQMTDAVSFLPGVDKSRVSSILTPNTRFIKITESGFGGGNVVPAEVVGAMKWGLKLPPGALEEVRENVLRSSHVGRLISNDFSAAMISAELINPGYSEDESASKTPKKELDYIAIAKQIESSIRDLRIARLTLSGNYPDTASRQAALDAALSRLKASQNVKIVASSLAEAKGELGQNPPPNSFGAILVTFTGTDRAGNDTKHLETLRSLAAAPETAITANFIDNGVSVHILGYTQIVGDVANGVAGVLSFFAIAILLTLVIVIFYAKSVKIGLMPVITSLIAVAWQLGVVVTLGYGIDPLSILIPFLTFAIGTSHGVHMVSAVSHGAHDGLSPFDAAKRAFSEGLLPGFTALASDVLGFLSISLIAIPVLQELAVYASVGVAMVLFSNLILLPLILSYTRFDSKYLERVTSGGKLMAPILDKIAFIATPRFAFPALLLGAGLYLGAGIIGSKLPIGDLGRGLPEFHADSRYNQDIDFITHHFSIGMDIIQVLAKTKAEGCVDADIVAYIDDFDWHMRNIKGVHATQTLPNAMKMVNAGFNEGSLRWKTLPRNTDMLVQASKPIETSTGLLSRDCDIMPVVIFTEDHRAETINRVINAVHDFQKQNPSDKVELLLATGNVGIMAAQNQAVKAAQLRMLLLSYLIVMASTFLLFRSVPMLVCVMLPLLLVSVMANALMVFMSIGLKVSTLPVASFGVGIGVDYGVYIGAILLEHRRSGLSLFESYRKTLHETGSAVLFTACTLAIGTATWVFSDLKFQGDMGILLTFMFIVNMVGAVILLPAFACLFEKILPANVWNRWMFRKPRKHTA